MLKNFKKFILTILFIITAISSFADNVYEDKLPYKIHNNVSIEVITSVESLNQKKELYFGLLFKLNPGWKIYWKNPGKAGYPPNIDWSKSKNIDNLEILWPKPKKFEILGMKSIGYEGIVVLPIKLQLQSINKNLVINFDVDYLTCKKICMPFNDNLFLEIPLGKGEVSENAEIIQEFLTKVEFSSIQRDANFYNILIFFFIALLGGIILNFMPCVLPVLSLKVYNVLSRFNKRSNKNIRKNFFATILGILSSFLLLAFFIIILKKSGQSVDWGFQFQSQYFLIFLTVILILFSLNLLDVFSIDIPDSFKNFINKVINLNKKNSELTQNFFLGFFLTILSTPCSAPFLGTALGFAFVNSNLIIFLIFFGIGLGLSSPYFILATYPKIFFYFPKPGKWMKKFKVFLSFLLIITALWLTSILYRHNITDNNLNNNLQANRWLVFDEKKIDKLVNIENKILFIDLTADWCITCFFNKSTVINRKKIKNAFKDYGVVQMRGDLTKPNETISEYINSFGRYGIPFNIIYSPAAPQGILLPEVLTVNKLLSTLRNIAND